MNPSQPTASGSRLRVGVVDDDETFLSMLNEVLSEEGYAVTAFSDGIHAQKAAYEAPFDIIVSDINMPGLTGIGLLRYLRDLKAPTEVILITADAQLETAVEAVRLGAFDYLKKPFENIEDVVALVNRAAEKILQARRQDGLVEAVIQKTRQLLAAQGAGKVPQDLEALVARTEKFVKDLQKTSSQETGVRKLSGVLHEIGLPNLLQMLSISGRSGKLFIQDARYEGEIWLLNGRLIHAISGRVKGENAIFRMFNQEEGSFHFYMTEALPPEGDIHASVDSVLLDCLRRLDEFRRLGPRVPPDDLYLRVKSPVPKTLVAEDRVTLELILRYSRVGDVLDYSPTPDLETVWSLIRLRMAGCLDIYYPSNPPAPGSMAQAMKPHGKA